ncbi:amidohydrolase family protein [Enterococcus aquimarinus]|uniref:N-acyl-D-amino-acid deacylase n=1 Tax=Enterococcus aquimarinus TaxID=328396 RepID=A0A1L8QSD2_9ENTE|nr:amidohydrolase family protein [Enterococcus aquimarinus]OJG10432.1 N-acyl-D-amino-acid deacylase [Enterococcus aquimarinus]
MDILIKNARLSDDQSLTDIAIEAGKISKIAPSIEGEATRVIDAEGRVVIPGLVESHIHLDKALIASRKPNKSGTLKEAIEVTAELKPTFTKEDIYDRAKKVLDMIIPNGVTVIRTHSEFDPAQGFTGFEVILKLKEEYKKFVDIQVVAFPQEGIFKAPGTEAMMHQAMEMGADVVGGIPYNDAPANDHIDLIFEIAKKYDKDIDLHQDFADEADHMSIEYLCQKTIDEGYQGRVSVGHLTALHALPEEKLTPILELMAKAQISVMALPATDLHLGARNDEYNVRRAVTPIRKLRDAGVNVCIATNNIRNAFTPYGNGDIFQTAMIAIPVAHLGGADDLPTVLPMITENPAKALKLDGYGIGEGNKANLVILDTKVVNDAIIDIPTRLFVIKDGRVTVETTKTVTVHQ